MLIADHYPPIYLGGGETHLESLAINLQERGYEVIVFTLAHAGLRNFEVKKGIDVYRYGGLYQKISFLFGNPSIRLHPPIGDPLIMRRLKDLVKKERPDVLHVHSSGGWIIYSVLPLKEKLGIPVVVTLHNFGLLCPVLTLTKDEKQCQDILTNKCISCGRQVYGNKSFLVYALLRLNRSQLKRVDRFIAINPYQKKIFVGETGLQDASVVVIPNGIDITEFSSSELLEEKTVTRARIKELEQLGVDPRAKKIVHISSLNANKLGAIEGLINAAPIIVEKFPHTQILMVGDGPLIDYVKQLAKNINERLGKSVIVITGFVKNNEMPRIMMYADIIVGVGRVALEGMACGKPVVIAGTSVGPYGGNYGGIVSELTVNELSTHNFSGRNSHDTTSPEKIANDCIQLLNDERYRSILGRFGREYVERQHDMKEVVQKVDETYRSVILGSNPRKH